MEIAPMTPKVQTAKPARGPSDRRPEPRVRVRFRAPFALRCGALLIDYILLALILTFSIMVARLMGGGARMAGGTAEKVGIVITLVVAILDLGVLAGFTGKTVGKWTAGLRIEREKHSLDCCLGSFFVIDLAGISIFDGRYRFAIIGFDLIGLVLVFGGLT